MTIVDATQQYAPTELFDDQDLRYPPAPEAPSGWDVVKAAIDKSSLTANIHDIATNEQAFRDSGPTDPTYDPLTDVKGYEAHIDYLGQAQNAREMELRKGVIDRNNAVNDTLAVAGWPGVAASIAVGILDPLSLATLVVPITGGIRALGALRGAAAGAVTLGAIGAGEEAVLHRAQPARTVTESVYGVGGAVLFGGLMGGVAGHFAGARTLIRAGENEALGRPAVTSNGTSPVVDFKTALADLKSASDTPAEVLSQIKTWEDAGHAPQSIMRALDEATTPDKVVIEDVKPIEQDLAEQNGAIDRSEGAADGSVGAMQVDDALIMTGGKGTLLAARITPIGRLAQATVAAAQNLGLKLNNTVFRFISKRTGLPAAAPMSADTELKKWVIGGMTTARRGMKDNYQKYRARTVAEGGKAISYNEFRNAVGEAMRPGGENHPIPEARAAGKAVSDAVFKPIFRQGIKARLFDPFMRALAHKASAEPYRMYLGKRRVAHAEVRAAYRQSSRDARRVLRSERTAGLRKLDAAERDQTAATERAYDWHKAKMQEHAAATLAERLGKVDEADKATRDIVKSTTRAEFDDKIKEIEAKKTAHKAAIKALFGTYKKDYAAFKLSAYSNQIAKLRDSADEMLKARLKTVDFTDKVARKAITDDVNKQLRASIREVNKQAGAAQKGVRAQARRDRHAVEMHWREKDRELKQQFANDLNEIAAGFHDLTPSEFAEAVHLAVVKDLPDEYQSPVMREAADGVRALLDTPEFANYLTRVYDQAKIKADGGKGLVNALQQHFIGEGMAQDEARRVAVESVNSITGLGGTAKTVGMSNRPISQAAPQLQRELAVPDSVLAPWLISDADSIALSYARSVGSRLELAKISTDYGQPGAWRLQGDLTDIKQRYAERINAAATPAEGLKLRKELEQVLKDINATADRILGVYDLPNDPTSFLTRAASVLKHTNFLSRMGNMMAASFADVSAPALAMGISRAYGPALLAMLDGTLKAAVKMSQAQLQTFGTASELLMPLWSHVPTEMGDIAMPTMQAAGQVFSHMTGISVWNQFGKSLSGVMLQHDMLTLVSRLAGKDLTTLSKSDMNALSDLARYGIGPEHIDAIAAQPVKQFGKLRLADTDAWTDPHLVATYRNSLVKMVDSFIVTPSAGDKFRWIKGPWPGLVAQFQSFAMSAHNKMMIPFLQDPNHARQAIGFVASSFAGAIGYGLKMSLAGKSDQITKMIHDKDYYGIARQVVANSNLMTVPSAAENIGGSLVGASGAGRYSSSGTETLLGPSAGVLDSAWELGKAIGPNGRVTASTVQKARNLVPFQNTWAANFLLNNSVGPVPGANLQHKAVQTLGIPEAKPR